MDPSTAPKPKVLIIGSGLGGMALAQSLRKQGVPFQLFERDEEPHARFQGWAISLHWYGVLLLEYLGIELTLQKDVGQSQSIDSGRYAANRDSEQHI